MANNNFLVEDQPLTSPSTMQSLLGKHGNGSSGKFLSVPGKNSNHSGNNFTVPIQVPKVLSSKRVAW